MAQSYVEYTANGVQTAFSVTFPYIDQSHVSVKVSDVVTAFTWSSASVISISPAPANGATVRIERNTPDALLVSFTGGNMLTKENLNLLAQQSLYRSIEAEEAQPLPSMPAPENRENTLFSYNASGTFELVPFASIFDVSGQLTSLPDNSVATSKIVDLAITTPKINDLAVTAQKLASDSVTTSKVLDDAITLAKIQNIATDRLLGRSTAGTGDVELLDAAAATALLNAFVPGGAKGLVPSSTGGDAGKALFGDGTWKTVPYGAATYTANNQASLDISPLSPGLYLISFNSLRPQVAGDDPSLRFSSGGSFLTASNYGYQTQVGAGATNGATGTGTAVNAPAVLIHNDQATSQISALKGFAFFLVGAAVTAGSFINGVAHHYNSAAGSLLSNVFSGHYNSAAQIDGIRFYYPGGNIVDGSITVLKVA
jgi:hypothetical protein